MNTNLKPVLARLGRGERLTAEESAEAFGIIMDGEATQAQIGGLLMAMRARGETVAELTGAVTAMWARMATVDAPPNAMDVCGTGGDGAATLNISTTVAFVTAATGIPIAKHGNRALSSRSGGADVLTALGIDIEPPISQLPTILSQAGCIFMFAPRHHPALRHAGPTRTELGTRTLLNLTGPLANPARVKQQLVGVFDPAWAKPMAETLKNLGTTSAWVVYGNGLDELTLNGNNHVVILKNGEISEMSLNATEAGLTNAPASAITGGDATHNAAALIALLSGQPGPYRDTVIFNTAAALIIAGKTPSLTEGAAIAAHAIDTGAAMAVLERLKHCSRERAA